MIFILQYTNILSVIKIYNKILYFLIRITNYLHKEINSLTIKIGLKKFSLNSTTYYKNNYINQIKDDNNFQERISKGLLHKKNISNFNFVDGDSFLEICSGSGENLIEIKKKFPKSNIFGCDIHNTCLIKSNQFNENNFKKIDLTEYNSLEIFPSKSIDHVYMMHSLAHIMSSNRSKTLRLRTNIINQMLRISKKKIFLIENKIYYGTKCNIDGITFIKEENKGKNRIEYFNNLHDLLPNDVNIRIFQTEYGSCIFEVSENNL